MTESEVRLLRSILKRNIRQSVASLSGVLLLDPVPDWMEGMTVGEICLARRYLGPQRVEEALQGTGIRDDDLIGSISLEDRHLIVLMLRERWPNLV
jgi:hypothetical protein